MTDFTYAEALFAEHDRWIDTKMLDRIERQNMLDNIKKRLDSIIATPEEIAAAEQRYKDAHPEPEVIPIVSETDRLMQPYSREYLAALDRPVMDAETADRVMGNEVMGDIAPSLALEFVKAFEKCGKYPTSTPQSGLERAMMSQKSLPTMYAPHGWADSAPDAETRTIREYYEKDRRS